jgi:hypothetical protein
MLLILGTKILSVETILQKITERICIAETFYKSLRNIILSNFKKVKIGLFKAIYFLILTHGVIWT